MLILSPRAVERLESFKPANRPLPKIFQMVKKGKIDEALFTGATINTPSMICVEDYLDALEWAEGLGGLPALVKRSQANLKAVEDWVAVTPWAHFLAADPSIRSSTSVCLTLDTDPANVKKMCAMLEDMDVCGCVFLGARRGRLPSPEKPRETRCRGETRFAGRLRHRRLPRRAPGPAHLVRRDGGDGGRREAPALDRVRLRPVRLNLNIAPALARHPA
jgi:hypothetical protein